MKIHELKVWKEYFPDILWMRKTFEVRKNDRDFKLGDALILREYDNEGKKYTGKNCTREVGYILEGGQFGIEKGFVVMGLKHIY